jgi:uncharacterized protein YjiS (DUF1127 family)
MSYSNINGGGAAAARLGGHGVSSHHNGSVGAFLVRVLDLIGDWQDRAAERHRLLALDDRMLRDIGVDRSTAVAEGGKTFWER